MDSPPATGSRGSGCWSGRAPGGSASGSAMDSTGTSMRRSSCLLAPASTILTLAVGADEEAADLLERVLGGAEADALDLRRPAARGACPGRGRAVGAHVRLQPLEREREVGAALGVRDGVDLVDDHRLDAAEHLARAGGEHQVQRLGCGDEDVGRVARHGGALALGRVAGADAHAHTLHLRGRCGADAAQGRAEVALDVVGERLERADVDDAGAARTDVLGRRSADAAEPVERPQERGERLAGAGGRAHEHVLAGGDRRPRLRLGWCGSGECLLEPVTDTRAEAGQGHGG